MRHAVLALILAGCAFETPTPPPEAEPGPRCVEEADALRCRHRTLTIATGAFGLSAREVHFEVPDGAPPAEGWPAAILFQGSLHSAAGAWESRRDDAFGGYHETALVRALLDAGYAVLTPEARYDGATYWDTNVVPYNVEWSISEDHQLMEALFAAIEAGELGPLDPTRLAAAGISSGGYMTSRMAVSYPGRFRALAIQSASYATCAGFACDVPELPADHPPTLFLHGDADAVVPVDSMAPYADELDAQGTPVEVRVAEGVGHEWLEEAPDAVVAHFDASLWD